MPIQKPPYDLTLIGNRYVFFDSLLDKDSPSSLQAYGQHAQSQIHSISNLVSNGGEDYRSETDTQLYQIKNYINFVEDMTNREALAEDAFFNSQIQLLRQNKEDTLANELEEYKNISTKDPYNYLLLTNKLFQESQIFEQNVTNALTRIQSISSNMEQLDDEVKKSISQAFEESYRSYRKKLLDNFSNIKDKNIDYQNIENINTTLATNINTVIRTIASNPKFISDLTTAFNNNPNLTDGEFKIIVINTIVKTVLDKQTQLNEDISDDTAKIVSQIMSNITNSEIPQSEYDKLFNLKTLTSIEESALNLESSLSNTIIQLTDKSIENLKNRYPNSANLIEELLKINEAYKHDPSTTNYNQLIRQKGKVTEALRNQILSDLKITRQDLSDKKLKRELKQKIRDEKLITPIALNEQLDTLLSNISISHDAVAEAVTSKDSLEQIQNVLVAEIPGKKIQLKADVRFSVGYLNSNAKLVNGMIIKDIIDSTISTYYKDFMQDYKTLGKGSTDIDAAITAYTQQLLKMKYHIDKIVKDNNLPDESRQVLYKALEDTFSASVSVKDYELYNNELGVHGGALGVNKAPEGVINNITKMYEMGGITTVDANKILFAVLNCGSDAVGSEAKQHIETYLLGGAALMMFDEGFVNTKNFFQYVEKELKQDLDGFKGQTGVHFYRVNTTYVPCSYILTQITNNLKQVYSDIEEKLDFSQIKQQNRVTIVNDITQNDIPKPEDKPTPLERWQAVSNKAQSEIKITFSFMAGLLDILQKFAESFKR